MKIGLIINDIEHYGGAERVAANLYNVLGNYHDVYYVSYFGSKSNYELKNKENIITLIPERKRAIKYYLFELTRKLSKAVKEKEIELLIVINRYTAVPALAVKMIEKCKVICCEHNSMRGYSMIDRHWFGKFHSWLLLNFGYKFIADKIVFLTQKDRDIYAKKIKNNDKTDNIYNWLSKELVDKDIQYDSEARTLLSIGKFDYAKGYEYLVSVADKVLKKHLDWEWHIYGDGKKEYKDKIIKLIKDHGLENQVLLKGYSKDIYKLYSKYAAFILTSRYEGFGMVLIEAKSRKLPLVSFDIESGPGEIISDGIDGYLIKPFEVEDMAEKICRLIENKELRERFSGNAYINIDKFSEEKITKQWLNLIDSMG